MAKQGRSHHLSPVKGGGVGGGFLKDHMVFRVRSWEAVCQISLKIFSDI